MNFDGSKDSGSIEVGHAFGSEMISVTQLQLVLPIFELEIGISRILCKTRARLIWVEGDLSHIISALNENPKAEDSPIASECKQLLSFVSVCCVGGWGAVGGS